jgi:hypothetical protein
MIQIVRPTNWTKDRTINIIGQLRRIDLYNSRECKDKVRKKWDTFDGMLIG